MVRRFLPAPLAFATLFVNGQPQQLTLKQLFPKADPIFVLVKLVGKNARIGVAGGSFTAGNTMLLEIGKQRHADEHDHGQRYVVKLVYVGRRPRRSPCSRPRHPHGGYNDDDHRRYVRATTPVPGAVP